MIEPVGDQAAQQVGAPQDRAVGRRRAAQDDVVAAAGAGMSAVQHELLGAEPRLARVPVERRGRVRYQNRAVAGGAHDVEGRANHIEGPHQIDLDQFANFGGRHAVKGSKIRGAGVADQDVESAEAIHRVLDHALAGAGLLGGYLTPALVGGEADGSGWLFAYVLLLTVACYGVERLKRWGWVA